MLEISAQREIPLSSIVKSQPRTDTHIFGCITTVIRRHLPRYPLYMPDIDLTWWGAPSRPIPPNRRFDGTGALLLSLVESRHSEG